MFVPGDPISQKPGGAGGRLDLGRASQGLAGQRLPPGAAR